MKKTSKLTNVIYIYFCYRSQNETLKKEILDQERGLKCQIATLEKKAHENWVRYHSLSFINYFTGSGS